MFWTLDLDSWHCQYYYSRTAFSRTTETLWYQIWHHRGREDMTHEVPEHSFARERWNGSNSSYDDFGL
jgi:hypothetical protein